jgi:hypothetical protein
LRSERKSHDLLNPLIRACYINGGIVRLSAWAVLKFTIIIVRSRRSLHRQIGTVVSNSSSTSPVTFPPGRERLATRPFATGSPITDMTMGIVPVACFAARDPGDPWVTIDRLSAQQAQPRDLANGQASAQPQRYSIARSLPSLYPRSRTPCRSAPICRERSVADLCPRKPILYTRATVPAAVAVEQVTTARIKNVSTRRRVMSHSRLQIRISLSPVAAQRR